MPDPDEPAASLRYVSLQPIDEGALDLGEADTDTDGCLGHDRLCTAHFTLVGWLLTFSNARTSRLPSARYHMCFVVSTL